MCLLYMTLSEDEDGNVNPAGLVRSFPTSLAHMMHALIQLPVTNKPVERQVPEVTEPYRDPLELGL